MKKIVEFYDANDGQIFRQFEAEIECGKIIPHQQAHIDLARSCGHEVIIRDIPDARDVISSWTWMQAFIDASFDAGVNPMPHIRKMAKTVSERYAQRAICTFDSFRHEGIDSCWSFSWAINSDNAVGTIGIHISEDPE